MKPGVYDFKMDSTGLPVSWRSETGVVGDCYPFSQNYPPKLVYSRLNLSKNAVGGERTGKRHRRSKMRGGQGKGTSSAKANANNVAERSEIASELLQAIESLKSDLKQDNEQLRKDINSLQRELGSKLDNITEDMKALTERVEKAETRAGHAEDMILELTDALIECTKRQRSFQMKLTDMESRSRRNNMRLFGVKEGEEGKSVIQFIVDLLRREVPLPVGLELKIQRAHRVPAHKPRTGDPPRPIVVNFQEFTTKELILREAWRKGRIELSGRVIYFDHDYATEIVQKRKEYQVIKRALKESGVRFQTPYTSMRIHWQDGVGTYSSAHDAGQELRKRGYEVAVPPEEMTEETRLRKCLEWQGSVRPRREKASSTAQRAKDRLKEFQRSEDK